MFYDIRSPCVLCATYAHIVSSINRYSIEDGLIETCTQCNHRRRVTFEEIISRDKDECLKSLILECHINTQNLVTESILKSKVKLEMKPAEFTNTTISTYGTNMDWVVKHGG